jgi:hypothetical protein
MSRHKAAFLIAAAFAVASPAPAKDRKPAAPPPNPVLDALSACRTIQDSAARLACFDTASARLAEAVDRHDLVVMDRAEVRQTRRSLFGFSLPRIPLFRGENVEEQEEITTTITAATSLGMGKWQFRIEDGAVWRTTEGTPGLVDPAAGQKVVIKRGALGNYFIRFNGQRGLRGLRVG